MNLNELAMTAVRAVVIYVFVLIVVRLSGKRTIGNFTAFDLIVAFIISEVVDEPIYGDVPMEQALLVIGLVAGLHYFYSLLGFHFPTIEKLLGGEPSILVRDGKLQREAMAVERISEEELKSLLREQQVDDVADVQCGTLETNGILSVIKMPAARELEKRDLQRARRHNSEPEGEQRRGKSARNSKAA